MKSIVSRELFSNSPLRPLSSLFKNFAVATEFHPETVAEDEHELKTAIRKVQSLSAEQHPTESNDASFDSFQECVREGQVDLKELVQGVEDGYLMQSDLYALKRRDALSSFAFQHIQMQLCGGRRQLSLAEVMDLVKERLIGKNELVLILRSGDLGPEEMRFMAQKGILPGDVLQAVMEEVKEMKRMEKHRFTEVKEELEMHGLSHGRLEKLLLSGDLFAEDVELLVKENCLSRRRADQIIENCAESVSMAYEEIEKFAELVERKRFTFEELEVMRAKGVLGSALIHYLAIRGAISEQQAYRLEEIEEDHQYLDPEDTDEEGENFSNLKSDEEFYPQDVPKDDIFALWAHLCDHYSNLPRHDGFLESYQESQLEMEKDKRTKRSLQTSSPTSGVQKVIEVSNLNPQHLTKTAMVTATAKITSATGKRKTSIAEVELQKGKGEIRINGRTLYEYFPYMDARCYVISPFLATDNLGIYDVDVKVMGGGWSGKAQAVRHGIAKALSSIDAKHFQLLKELGLSIRDARIVERKKPGKAKARKSFQWVKR